jgi:hypothetical protein
VATVHVGKLKEIGTDEKEGETRVKLKPRTDSIPLYQSNFAINPVSIVLFGLNINYLGRFGENYRHCLYVPARVSSYWGNTFYADLGVGYAYALDQNLNMTFLVSVVPTVYFFDDEAVGGLIFSFMGIKNLTERVTLNGSFGVGPTTRPVISIPIFINGFFGVGFNLGDKKIINKKL